MQITRTELDALAARHRLTPEAIGTMLDFAHARPDAAELHRFVGKLLKLSAVLSLGAGLVFFVAANWDAFISAGALLALFGQTYQTGADVYELFLTWALLGLPLVFAAQWSVVWAAWALVLNVALLIFCSARPEAGWLWAVFGGFGLGMPQLLTGAMFVNLVLWLAGLVAARTQWAHVAPQWLCRLMLAGAVAFGTGAGVFAIIGSPRAYASLADPLVVLIVLGLLAGIALHTLRRRIDVFPLAASLIVLSSSVIGWHASVDNVLGKSFMLAAWLVACSAVSGQLLMKAVRTWRNPEALG